MMMQATCRGFVTAQYMQPEPAKYAHAPTLEAKTFMQPEQPYYAHHPGRFVYVKDVDTDTLFSVPYEPVRSSNSDFKFVVEPHRLVWKVTNKTIEITMSVSLSSTRPLELWQIDVRNLGHDLKNISVTPYFPVGYQSWMNQSANYVQDLDAIICRSITPYQKHADYFKNKELKDITFLMAESTPDSYECRQEAFEGEGGLHSPSSLASDQLGQSDSLYELPTAALQYKLSLGSQESRRFRFAFGPAKDTQEVTQIRKELFQNDEQFGMALEAYRAYIEQSKTPLRIETPDSQLDNFVNHWLSRQIYYHGDVNRLSTDPQTRNYLQDNMGMAYMNAATAGRAFNTALSQQKSSGEMPDGILLSPEAELKYINQVPHMDHCVWLPICLSAYLEESDDYAFLQTPIGFADSEESATAFEHVSRALRWLYQQRDHRGLNFIAEGDWCDPMNMVGYKGKGVSAWLTLATSYACKVWAEICANLGKTTEATEWLHMSAQCNEAVNQHMWSKNWYGRGITDDDRLFGVEQDDEGKIFLNPQSWAMLSGAADHEQQSRMMAAIESHLESPYGVEMLSPAYTRMREDIGRVTQKHPGSAENGSVYNHAAAFYGYALYQVGQSDKAFDVLKRMIPGGGEADLMQRGQLPVFIPNYYRGAYRQYKRTAGRSSQLFNTGTVPWFYRCLINGLFGVQGCRDGLMINPQLPSDWPSAVVERRFRNASFEIHFKKSVSVNQLVIHVDGKRLNSNVIVNIEANKHYLVNVQIPDGQA